MTKPIPQLEIVRVLSKIQDSSVMRHFFDEIFTPGERADLSLRWELMKLLHQGLPQRQIADRLGISLCKITRGSKILKEKNSVSKRILDDLSSSKTLTRE